MAMLAKEEARRSPQDAIFDKFGSFLRTGSMDDLADAVGPRTCDCGATFQAFTKCQNSSGHSDIQDQIRAKFAIGDRVFYNCWAYLKNDPGRVAAYVKPKPENGSFPWAWLSIKFDRLKSARQCPVFSSLGWHLTHYQVDDQTLRQAGTQGDMDKIKSIVDMTSRTMWGGK
jgi:hypothetical protein